MTIEINGSRNYSAVVITVPELNKVENSDFLYTIDMLGITAIVDASWKDRVGELALLFPAEVQLNEHFTRRNNLFDNQELNENPGVKGYIGKNRRVRSIKLRGTISNGLVLPLDSLNLHSNEFVLGFENGYFSEGDVFDTIDGVEICQKYVVPVKESSQPKGQAEKAFRRVDNTFLPLHYETGQWLREKDSVDPDEILIITQKLHGTSVRLANTVVKRQLTWKDRLAQKLGIAVKDHDYDLVAGSKRVIKDPGNSNQNHFYDTDIWTHSLGQYGDVIPKNFVVYGELVGYTPVLDGGQGGGPIQKGHTYECQPGYYELFVYRVAVVTEDADLVDLSWDQVRAFCERAGLWHTPELARVRAGDLDIEDYLEKDFRIEWIGQGLDGHRIYRDQPVMLGKGGTGADEGIVIRSESGFEPRLWKFKNPSHYLYETAQLDSGEVDLESEG